MRSDRFLQLKGKWVGEWSMSKGMEKFLRRMIAPNADLRCTAVDAMGDCYWSGRVESITASHSSYNSAPFDLIVAQL